MNTPYSRAPHVGSPGWPASETSPHAALLIDFDNVTMGRGSNLSSELKALLNSDIIKGKVAVQRAYADWRRYPQYIVPLSEASIDLIFAPAYGSSKKNATDIRMAIDALELVFVRPEIGTFILLTGDSDFSSVVLKLKEYGKYVIGVGIQESSSDILVQNCDEYYSYTSITGLTKTSEAERAQFDPWVLVTRAVEKMVDRGDVMRSDRLKQVMREIDPGFNEGEHGFSKFSRFLAEASSKGLVDLKRMENGQYEVGLGRGKGKAKGRPSRKGTPATAADESPLEHAYELLRVALGELTSDGRSPARDSDVKRRLLVLEPNFDEAELGFPKFSRFLAQAQDSAVVELRRKEPEGYTEVLLVDAGGGAATDAPAESEPGRGSKRRERRSESVDESPVRPRGRRTRPRTRDGEEPAAESHHDSTGSDDERRGSRSRRGRRGESRTDQRAEPHSESHSESHSEAASDPESDPETDSQPESRADSRGSRSRRRGEGDGDDDSQRERDERPRRRERGGRRERRSRDDSEDRESGRASAGALTEPVASEIVSTRDEPSRSVVAVPGDDAEASVEVASTGATPETTDEPVQDEPVQDEPVREEPTHDEPVADEPVRMGRGLADDMPVIRAVSGSSSTDTPTGRRLNPRNQRRRRGPEGPPPIFEGQGIPKSGGAGDKPKPQDSLRADADQAPTLDEALPADIFDPGQGVIDPEALGLPTDPGAITRYLTHRYKGVGARTAETLVERFGDEVFEILHAEPRRVTEVLPERRAAQLVQAWRADLARRSAGEADS